MTATLGFEKKVDIKSPIVTIPMIKRKRIRIKGPILAYVIFLPNMHMMVVIAATVRPVTASEKNQLII